MITFKSDQTYEDDGKFSFLDLGVYIPFHPHGFNNIDELNRYQIELFDFLEKYKFYPEEK